MIKKRVLILSASAGTGHLRAADALAKTFRQSSEVEEVLHDDALDYSSGIFREVYSTLYTKMIKLAPKFLGWWYDSSDAPWRAAEARDMLDRLNTVPLVRFIQTVKPHIIVCTHFMPAGVIAHLISKKLLETHLSIVVTDYDIHAMWLSKVFHRYFVALDEAKAHLVELGLPARRIVVSGIPVDPVFSHPVNTALVKKQYNLDPHRPVVLFSAGALGVSPAESVVKRLMEMKTPIQTIVICGKNPDLQTEVEKLVSSRPDSFRVLGYTNEMHRIMHISDVFIGKPGGLTSSEAMVCGLPMVIVSPIPGQEFRNSDHLLEEGVAIKCNEITVLPYKIESLLNNAPRLQRMKDNALRLGRPHAAQTIVDTLLRDEDLMPMKISRKLKRQMKRTIKGI